VLFNIQPTVPVSPCTQAIFYWFLSIAYNLNLLKPVNKIHVWCLFGSWDGDGIGLGLGAYMYYGQQPNRYNYGSHETMNHPRSLCPFIGFANAKALFRVSSINCEFGSIIVGVIPRFQFNLTELILKLESANSIYIIKIQIAIAFLFDVTLRIKNLKQIQIYRRKFFSSLFIEYLKCGQCILAYNTIDSTSTW
jgi:hypothetical protein